MSIKFLGNRFAIETENTSYIIVLRSTTFMGTNETVTAVCNGYWGEKVLNPEEIPDDYHVIGGSDSYLERELNCQEYPAYGGKYYENECLKVKLSDGVRDLRLSYKSHKISDDGNQLTITLKDIYYPIEVDLNYKIYDGLDLIDRNSVIKNLGKDSVLLETMYSASWICPYSRDLTLTYMTSAWGTEYNIEKQPLNQSPVLLESRAGVSNATTFPYFAVDKNATEDSGEVWFGSLQYSGNWQIKAGRDRNACPQILGGISDFNTTYSLAGGEEFETPVFTGGYVNKGFGESKRQFHDYIRKTSKSPWTNRVMPVLYNAWATFEFNLDEEMLMAQAERASKLGVEMFLIDDGWFKNRNDERTGLGDWEVDEQKFPNGLTAVINKVNELGMIFGLWVEPEMVSEESDLYKAHPDWILKYPTRQPVKRRHQYVLNMGREDVYEFTVNWLDKLLSENNIGYLKWDMYRFLSEVNWNFETNSPDDEVYIKYVRNLYRICEHINEKYPEVLFENCASGGLRADLGMAKWCARINRSDIQDCIDILKLHEGFTYVNMTKAAGGGCHLHHPGGSTMCGRIESTKRMAYTAMMGSFSLGYDLRRLSPEEIDQTAEYIKLYKRLRETVQLGDMYLLRSLYDPKTPAVIYQFVSKDKEKSAIFVYNNNKGNMGWLEALKLKGLNADKKYKISTSGFRNDEMTFADTSGDTLMKMGLAFNYERMVSDDSTYGCFAIILE